jgi:hypothetical protein
MSYITVETKKSYNFYIDVIDNLLQLVKIRKQEEENMANGVTDSAPVIARYNIEKEHVQVKMEYFIYINQYGVPSDGIFIDEYLERIRQGLGGL